MALEPFSPPQTSRNILRFQHDDDIYSFLDEVPQDQRYNHFYFYIRGLFAKSPYQLAIELLDLPPVFDAQSYCLKYGGAKYKTTGANRRKKERSVPKWTVDLDLSNISEDERFKVQVYFRPKKKCVLWKEKHQCLGFYEGPIRDVLIGGSDTIVIPMSNELPCLNTYFKIFREDATDYSPITQSADGDRDVDTSAAIQSGPSNTIDPGSQNASDLSGPQPGAIPATSVEDDRAIAAKVMETAKPKDPSEWISKLTDGVDIVEHVIDVFKDVHPAASIACSFISICIVKQQTEQDTTVLRLYEAMITTYKEASDDRLLWKQTRLEPIYKSLFQTTNECRMLIEGYTNKNRLKRLFSLNVTQKAEEFIQGFENLRKQLNSGVAKDALAVTLGVRAEVDSLAMRMSLQELRPGKELGPKSTCLPGTRVETINYLMSWIVDCDDSVLWCSGLAGTGKSSLVGTLHKLLSFHMGSHSRLAAFIRYDRTEYRNSSGLITSIAYSLGMFDQRIGDAIAKALTESRAAVKMPASESRTQFRLLLQDPLEKIQELQNGGPLVVIIDGLDESDVSTELLEVLADGFGPKLPFMRLIVSSRPEEKIARVFKKCRHVHLYSLDTSSDEVKLDIQYFIRQRFASINDESVWGTRRKEDVITLLAERASGLFIWAATVCSFLCGLPCLRRLNVLLETTIPANATAALTILYRTALDTVVSEVTGEDEDVRQWIRAVLGALIVRKGKMTVPMLPELVLQQGDPRAQLIVARLGSVVQERSDRSLELIHKSFDDFLRDNSRCGSGWFIDVKEHGIELARRCVLSLTMFLDSWTPISARFEEAQLPPHGTVPCNDDSNSYSREKVLNLYHAVPSHIGDYAVKVLSWHPDALLELGIDTYRSLFERYFLFWLEILYAFSRGDGDRDDLVYNTLVKVISLVNAEVTDQNLRTYVYHAFTFWDRFAALFKWDPVRPAHSVYTHAMTISPSANFICRDWGQSSGVNAPFDKERLLALIPCSRNISGFNSHERYVLNMFQGSQHIQSEYILKLLSTTTRPGPFYSGGSVLFDVDTGRILDPSPPSILSCFPNLLFPCGYFTSEGLNFSFHASGQIIRLTVETRRGDGPEYSLDSTQYEIIKRPSRDPQDAMIFNVDDDDDCDHRADNSNTKSMFISFTNTQTSRCDNYLLPAIGGDSTVLHYAHGLLAIDKRSGMMLNVKPGITGCKKWITLDGGANEVNTFAVMEDGSRLLGLTGAAGKISLREWETSTGTLCCERIYDCPGAPVLIRCQMSPDGSKVAVSLRDSDQNKNSSSSENWRLSQTYILGITSGSSADITDLKDTRLLVWFPDSKRIAYFRSWQCKHSFWDRCNECYDLVVQHLASGQITTIHRWYSDYTLISKILVTPDGSRVITSSYDHSIHQGEFRTWDVSDL
ncbi:uncharacterized protein ARMOST_12518 [Armillaria ostoyae]|uniref:Nephrocystin 3-like N-terminal domain-containing protein n=1 Tax=Armillaria ostoyae TaxID=47428 RepID=A0A284RK53_ARMOS|nr:uncharacterized protein ARMOST_12518 [Armillaria ostoyae]